MSKQKPPKKSVKVPETSRDDQSQSYVEPADANPERRANGCMIYRGQS